MSKFFKNFDYRWKIFILLSLSFGTSMMFNHDWKSAALAGLAFGTIMTLMTMDFKQKPKIQYATNDILVVEQSKIQAYIVASVGWIFAFISFFFIHIFKANEGVNLYFLIIPMFFSILGFGSFLFSNTQALIGNNRIVLRNGFKFLFKDKEIKLNEIKTAKVTWYQGIQLISYSGKKLTFLCNPHSLRYLPEYRGDSPNPQVEGLYRLKQEIKNRTKNHSQVKNDCDDMAFETINFSPIRLRTLFIIGIIVFSLGLTTVYSLYLAGINKLEQAPTSKLRYSDIDNTFSIYRDQQYFRLFENFKKECLTHKDHNCRLASYFKSFENKEDEALVFLKISCSIRDPHSCYGIYINSSATASDKELAGQLLNNICKTDEFKLQTCCTCYDEQKTKN